MEQGIIDKIVSQEAFNEVARLEKAILDVVKSAENVKIGGKKGASNTFSKEYELMVQQTEKTRLATEKAEKAAIQRQIAEKKLADTMGTLTREQKLQQQITNSLAGSYNQMQAQLSKNLITLKAMSEEQRNNAEIGGKLIAENLKLNTSLKAIDATMGMNQRNVGNYKSGLFGMSQVLREMPNFAIDARIGFMSLSNNLPYLADEFKKVKETMVEVKDEFGNITQKQAGTGAAWKAMLGSIISMNTAIVLLSTVLVLYGDKLVDLFKTTDLAKKAHEDFIKSIEDGSSEYVEATENVIKARVSLQEYKDGTITADQFLKTYNETLGQVAGNTDDVNVAQENIVNKSDAYLNSVYLMAEANIVLAQSAKSAAAAEMMKQEDPTKFWNRISGAFKQLMQNIKDPQKGLDTFSSFMMDVFGGFGTGFVKEMGRLEESSKSAFDTFATLRKKALDTAKENKLDLIGLDKNGKASKVINDANEAMASSRDGLTKLQKQYGNTDEALRQFVGDLKDLYQYAGGNSGLKERTDAMEKNLKSILSKDQIEQYNKFVEEAEQATTDKIKQQAEDREKIISASLQSITQLYDIFAEHQQYLIDTEKESKLKQLELNTEAELSNEQLTADQKIDINTAYKAEKDAIERKAFEQEKQLRINQVLMDAAVADIRIWSENSALVAAALSLILGATTTASILQIRSQQYPAFEKGGIMDHDGIALVGEKRHELGITPDGSVFLTPNVPTLMHLQKGTEIYPDASAITSEMIAGLTMKSNVNLSTKALEKKLDKVIEAVKGLKSSESRENLHDYVKFARQYKN